MPPAVSLRRARVGLLAALSLFALLLAAQGVAGTRSAAGQEVQCEFVLGFADLRELLGAELVGNCLEDQSFAPNGDALQATTGGLMVWRKADNWTAFTDGSSTWINGPEGVQMRANNERFGWEPTPTNTPRPTATPRPSPTPFPFATATNTAVPAATATATAVPAPLRVVAQGVGGGTGSLSANEFGFGFVVENPNESQAADAVAYTAVFYAADGTIVGSEEGLIRRILPRQRLGVGGRVYIASGRAPVRVDARLTVGAITIPVQPIQLVGEFSSLQEGVVRGIVRNLSGRDAPLSVVSVIAYNAGGAIIGGGTGDVAAVPANGIAAVEVPVISSSAPSRVELHAWPATNLP